MFFISSFNTFNGLVRAFRPQTVASRVTAWPARVHVLVASSPAQAATGMGRDRVCPQGLRRRAGAIATLRRAGKLVARAALRAAFAGNPLTPTGYALLIATLSAVALVAILATSSLADELASAIRLSWWFS
ncbi:MAG: hypothetical protein JO371_14735 [Paraburkholderia sp.]|nr:hypothetical protein [Paraburkholderia sp.]